MAEESPGDRSISVRIFHAMITRADDAAKGEFASVEAMDLTEARRLMEVAYGKGNIFGLHDAADAEPLV